MYSRSRSHSLISRSPSRGRCQDRTPARPPTRFNKITDPQTPHSRQDPNETSTLMKTNSEPYPQAGSVGSIHSAGLITSIIIRGVRHGIDPRRTKRSTTVLKPVKRMPLATITTVVSLLMTCWKLRLPLRSPGTQVRPSILPPVPLRQVPIPLLQELDHCQPDGKSDIPPREGLTTLIITPGPRLGWTPDARQ